MHKKKDIAQNNVQMFVFGILELQNGMVAEKLF